MEKIDSKQHVQLPNKMTEENQSLRPGDILMYLYIKRYMSNDTKEAFPSQDRLRLDTGLAINTIKKSIQRLVNAGYIEIHKRGQSNCYKFLKWDKFEPCSFDFLSNKELSFKEKAYLIASQQYMFKDSKTEDGVITFSNADLAERINMTPKTIQKYNESLEEKGLVSLERTNLRDEVTGCEIIRKNFHLTKFQQGVVFALMNMQEQLNTHEDKISQLEMEIKKLSQKLNEKN